jgi:hypothetical protein
MTATVVPVTVPVVPPRPAEADWQEPSEATDQPGKRWPVLDPLALHGLAGKIVATIDPHTEADPVAVLVSTVAEFGAQCGKSPHAVADSAPHPARLNVALVGRTAKGRKGSALANVARVSVPADPAFARDRRMNGFGSGEALVDAVRGTEDNTDHRMIVVEPEFARVLTVAGRDGSTLSIVVRQAWDGDRLAVRSRGKTTVADESHVCVVGHITIDELRAKLTDTDTANGFANRFLFVCVKRSKLLPTGGSLDDGDLAPLVRQFAERVKQAQRVGRMYRTNGAEALWADLYAEMGADEPGGLLGAVTARDSAQVLRLSVTYALLDGCSLIDVEHVRAAWALWRYCRDSAAYIFGGTVGDPVADRLLAAVVNAGDTGLDGRAQDAVFSGHASRRQLDTARDLLEARGLIHRVTIQTGGRPATVLKAGRDPLSASPLCPQGVQPPDSSQSGALISGQRGQSHLQDKEGEPSLAPTCGQSGLSGQSPNSDSAPPPSDADFDRYIGAEL